MKAVRMERPGDPDVLQYVEVPKPVPGAGEVLVRAHAIGVNMPEALVRRGAYAWMPPLPAIPGIEMSGVVAAIGPGVRGVEPGQAVYVSARELVHRGGCYAEYIAVPERSLYVLDPGIDLDSAAAMASYQVAWHVLNTATRGFTYESVLVPGAAGAIGSAILQLACAAGKTVIAPVGSSEKIAFALQQGAAAAFDRNLPDAAEKIAAATAGKGVDLILDPVGGPDFGRLIGHLAPLGMIVLYGYLRGWPKLDLVGLMKDRSDISPAVRLFSMHALDDKPDARRAATTTLLRMLRDGAIRPVIHSRMPLAEAANAHRLLESGKAIGKILLKP